MKLINTTRTELIDYTASQIAYFFPDKRDNVRKPIEKYCDDALDRLNYCINGVQMWRENEFNYLHSSQYCTYIYYLSNTIWSNTKETEVCTKLFLLNKALNSIDCFYEIELPKVFLIAHSVGIVLAKATYGNYLTLYQNSTVGKNHGIAPVIEDGVVMYPNTAIIGRSHVRKNTLISQGTSVINQETPGNSIAYAGEKGSLIFKPSKRDVFTDLFRI